MQVCLLDAWRSGAGGDEGQTARPSSPPQARPQSPHRRRRCCSASAQWTAAAAASPDKAAGTIILAYGMLLTSDIRAWGMGRAAARGYEAATLWPQLQDDHTQTNTHQNWSGSTWITHACKSDSHSLDQGQVRRDAAVFLLAALVTPVMLVAPTQPDSQSASILTIGRHSCCFIDTYAVKRSIQVVFCRPDGSCSDTGLVKV